MSRGFVLVVDNEIGGVDNSGGHIVGRRFGSFLGMNQRKAFLMSIHEELGLDVHEPSSIITARWAEWVTAEPVLAHVPDPHGLGEWLSKGRMRADPAHWQTANQVLLALARLAAQDGGNDRDAALVLAWLMLPAAATVARQYQDGDPDIDAIVAGQLFIQVRTYPWRTRPGSVGAGIGRDLRRHVGRELGIQAGQRLVAVDPVVLDTQPADPEQGEVAEVAVAALLDDAERAGAIDAGQRQLLEDVLAQADALGPVLVRNRSLGGLTSPAITDPIARRRAVSVRTLRRQVSRATAAIAEVAALWEVA